MKRVQRPADLENTRQPKRARTEENKAVTRLIAETLCPVLVSSSHGVTFPRLAEKTRQGEDLRVHGRVDLLKCPPTMTLGRFTPCFTSEGATFRWSDSLTDSNTGWPPDMSISLQGSRWNFGRCLRFFIDGFLLPEGVVSPSVTTAQRLLYERLDFLREAPQVMEATTRLPSVLCRLISQYALPDRLDVKHNYGRLALRNSTWQGWAGSEPATESLRDVVVRDRGQVVWKRSTPELNVTVADNGAFEMDTCVCNSLTIEAGDRAQVILGGGVVAGTVTIKLTGVAKLTVGACSIRKLLVTAADDSVVLMPRADTAKGIENSVIVTTDIASAMEMQV